MPSKTALTTKSEAAKAPSKVWQARISADKSNDKTIRLYTFEILPAEQGANLPRYGGTGAKPSRSRRR